MVWDAISAAALSSNPGFNVYKITDLWPISWVRTQSFVSWLMMMLIAAHSVVECIG